MFYEITKIVVKVVYYQTISVGGVGRLTDKIVDKIQTYYGYAIRNNIGDIDATIKAIFFHMILGPLYESKKQQHSYCPVGSDTWCGFNRNESNCKQTNCLPFVFRGELKPIFERLSSKDLLNRCAKGLNSKPKRVLK